MPTIPNTTIPLGCLHTQRSKVQDLRICLLLNMVEFECFVEEVSVQCGVWGSEAVSQALQLNVQVLRGRCVLVN